MNDSQQAIAYADEPHISPLKKWGSLVVLSLALAIIVIDTTLLNVSLKTIINDLKTDIQSMQWVITAYSLVLAAFTITGGRLGDLFGRKKMFMLGAVIFAIGSFLASISKNIGMMIAGEAIIEGLGAALMMPATASLLVANFKGRERAIAFGVWGGIAAASSAIGPILGGWLTTNYSWRWGFRINIAVVALLLIGSLLIRESKDTEEKRRLDIVGVVLSALGMLSIVFAFIKATTYGWLHEKAPLVLFNRVIGFGGFSSVPVFIAIGLIILILFVLWQRYLERKGKTPLVSIELLKNKQFTIGTLTTTVISLSMAGLVFSIPVFLQAVQNLDALHTGLTMLPLSLSLLVAAPLGGILSKHIHPKYIIQAGLLINTIGYIVMRYTIHADSTVWQLTPGFIIFGIGMGLTMAQISNITLSAVSIEEAGEASGVNNTMRQVGMTLGTAILGAILISTLTSNLSKGIEQSAVFPAPLKASISQSIANQASDVEFSGGAKLPEDTPAIVREEISRISKDAATNANKTTLLYGAIFAFLGFIIASFLPKKKDIEVEKSAAPSPSESLVPLKRALLMAIAAILVVAGLTGVLGYYIGEGRKKTAIEPITPTPAPVDTTPTFIPPRSPAPDIVQVPTPSQPAPEPPASPTPTATPAPPASRPTPAPSTYNNSALGLSFTIPAAWNMKTVAVSQSTTNFYNPVSGASYGQIDSYSVEQAGDLTIVKQQLKASPDITKIEQVKIDGNSAIKFWTKNSTAPQYAIMHKQRIYYISGKLAENSVISTIKFK